MGNLISGSEAYLTSRQTCGGETLSTYNDHAALLTCYEKRDTHPEPVLCFAVVAVDDGHMRGGRDGDDLGDSLTGRRRDGVIQTVLGRNFMR